MDCVVVIFGYMSCQDMITNKYNMLSKTWYVASLTYKNYLGNNLYVKFLKNKQYGMIEQRILQNFEHLKGGKSCFTCVLLNKQLSLNNICAKCYTIKCACEIIVCNLCDRFPICVACLRKHTHLQDRVIVVESKIICTGCKPLYVYYFNDA